MANRGATNASAQSGSLTKPPVVKHPTVPFGLGQYGAMKEKEERYLFGTDDEIRNRNATGYNFGGTPPENAAPNFKQIVAGPTSKDLHKPGPTSRQGQRKVGTTRRAQQTRAK